MQRFDIGGIPLEIAIAGTGRPLLFLHAGDYFAQNQPFLDKLARRWQVLTPRHPGFGGSERPEDFRTVHDLAYLYLDLLEQQRLGEVVLVGSSFGGWIALEMCIRSLERVKRLVLIDSLGVKFGGREERDIVDIYALAADDLLRRTFFDPGHVPDYSTLDDAEAMLIARDRAATALYGWRPYMHNPGLRRWLHRVRVPALVIWGESDGIARPDYGEKLCRSLPEAQFETIAKAGHYPQIERSDAVVDSIEAFARADTEVSR
ncbi:MAG: alpha/beta hydrolase [Alphaproteobacteria bacterium]|nr:alpha/beta hydrolase [Alphaproteobacteria bacterium]